MTILKAALIVLGSVAALAAACWIIVILEKKLPWGWYDERQQTARGNAYRVSYILGILYYVFMIIYMDNPTGTFPEVYPGLLLFIGLALQIISCHIYCLLTDAILPLGDNSDMMILTYSAFTVFCLLRFIGESFPEGIPVTGADSIAWANLILGVCAASLAVMHIIRRVWPVKE